MRGSGEGEGIGGRGGERGFPTIFETDLGGGGGGRGGEEEVGEEEGGGGGEGVGDTSVSGVLGGDVPTDADILFFFLSFFFSFLIVFILVV